MPIPRVEKGNREQLLSAVNQRGKLFFKRAYRCMRVLINK